MQSNGGPASEAFRWCVVWDSVNVAETESLKIVRLDKDLPLPKRAHSDDAGIDLFCSSEVILEPGQRALVGTGIAIALPLATVGLIHPRSGLAAKHGLSIVNAPGTVDAGYRGEIKVNLINLDPHEAITLPRGTRIAQLLVQKVELPTVEELDSFDGLAETTRGVSGHGSTGFN